MCVGIVYMNVGVLREQKKVSDSWELELQAVVSHLEGLLEIHTPILLTLYRIF